MRVVSGQLVVLADTAERNVMSTENKATIALSALCRAANNRPNGEHTPKSLSALASRMNAPRVIPGSGGKCVTGWVKCCQENHGGVHMTRAAVADLLGIDLAALAAPADFKY
jgi:hypothetical protein